MRGVKRAGMLAAIAAIVVIVPSPALANTVRPGCASANPFTDALVRQLAATYPGQRFSASVLDERTGCQYDLHPELRLTTASVVKVEILAGVLLRAQSEGRPLSANERNLIEPMITQSADQPASELFASLGGAPGMQAVGDAFGLVDTVPSEPIWGLTTTSARDQVHLLRQVLLGDFGPLGPSYRADAAHYMSHVVAEQRWGISAGVRSDWPIQLKNGFAPSYCCAWRLNSAGVVHDPAGGAYVVAILSDGWPTEASGIDGVETVGRSVSAALGRSYTTPRYFLRNQNSTGVADTAFAYGNPVDAPLVGDWEGDGDDTAGVDRNAIFFLRNDPGGGFADVVFAYGNPGDEVIVGDWDGDGDDTIGIRRANRFFLRNQNSTGIASFTFDYGDPGDKVIVGDWDGDGDDTIGVHRGIDFFLRNQNSTGVADTTFTYGNPGDAALAGDWDGNASDTPGVHRGNAFFLRNQNSSGVGDISFNYGDAGDDAVVGDWNGDGTDSIGIVRTRS